LNTANQDQAENASQYTKKTVLQFELFQGLHDKKGIAFPKLALLGATHLTDGWEPTAILQTD
jgi:hypothetical protein